MSQSGPQLRVRASGREIVLDSTRELTIGRDPNAGLPIPDSSISRRHIVIRYGPAGWEVEDPGSSNGTFQHGNRVSRLQITAPTQLRLGNAESGPDVELVPVQAAPPQHPPAVSRSDLPTADYSSLPNQPGQTPAAPQYPPPYASPQPQQPPWQPGYPQPAPTSRSGGNRMILLAALGSAAALALCLGVVAAVVLLGRDSDSALAAGGYECFALAESGAVESTGVTITIERDGKYRENSTPSAGTYTYDPSTRRITWQGGRLEGEPARYETGAGENTIVLDANTPDPTDDWNCR